MLCQIEQQRDNLLTYHTMYKNALLRGIPTTLTLGMAVTVLGSMGYAVCKDVMYEIRATPIDTEIALHFNPKCTKEFYKQQKELWHNSSLYKPGSIVVMSEKWKKNGKWEECMRN